MIHPVKDAAQRAVQANKDHQYALRVYTERLENELQRVDRLLNLADFIDQEDEPDLDVGGFVIIPGAKKAFGPIPSTELLSSESPFYSDARKRSRFLEYTCAHPMKAKELEALAEAVRTENLRRESLNSQARQSLPNLQPSVIDIEMNQEGLDWVRVAEKVSEASSITRSPQECEIRWLGDRHPQISHAPWSTEELSNLKSIISEIPTDQIDWVEISKKLGTNRTPIDCMRHGIQRMSHLWTPESDNRLVECVKIYGLDNWNLVASHVSEDATATGCQSRYYRTVDPSVKHGNWTSEEDEKLRRAVTVYGNSWVEIATMIPGRTNDQCRDRWSDCLNPTLVKGKWTSEEDECLLLAVQAFGGKWKEISQRLGGGRTDNMCRSRYDALKKRRAREQGLGVAGDPGLQGVQQAHSSRARSHGTPFADGPDLEKQARTARRQSKSDARQKGKGREIMKTSYTAPNAPGDNYERPRPKPKFRTRTNSTTVSDDLVAGKSSHSAVSGDTYQEIHQHPPFRNIVAQGQPNGDAESPDIPSRSTGEVVEPVFSAIEHEGYATPQKTRRVDHQPSEENGAHVTLTGDTAYDAAVSGMESPPTTGSKTTLSSRRKPNIRQSDVAAEGSLLQEEVHQEEDPKAISAKLLHPSQPVRSSARLRRKQEGPPKEPGRSSSQLAEEMPSMTRKRRRGHDSMEISPSSGQESSPLQNLCGNAAEPPP